MIVRRAAASGADVGDLLAHEQVHVAQFRRFGFLGFVRRYLTSYAGWRLRGYGHWASYRRIPFEAEAVWTVRIQSLRAIDADAV